MKQAQAEGKKICHFFTPLKMSVVFGSRTTEFLKELGYQLRQVSGEANSFVYLTQRLSVAIQLGNAASVLGTIVKRKSFFVLSIVLCLW